MRRAWRIVKEKHAATAFEGEGAWRYAGRWNARGTRVVYTSATLSLAALESLLHLIPPVTFTYLAIPVDFDPSLVETIDPASLPADWTASPPPPSTVQMGDLWAKEKRSAVLELPSTIIPTESNYLLNPAHPDFKKIRLGPPVLFAFDQRLL